MKQKDQVCNWELAQKLEELGVEQDSLWYWIKNGKELIDKQTYEFKETMRSDNTDCSAFTVAELGKLLPPDIGTFKNNQGDWNCVFLWPRFIEYNPCKIKSNEDTEADTRAKMLVWLLKNKKIW